jgi:hypothetical protein
MAATLSATPSALDNDIIDLILVALALMLVRIRARSRRRELQRRVVKRFLYVRGARKQRPYKPPVRYKKDVWSWEGLDEWKTFEFTRFKALLINISRSDHSTDNEGHKFQKSEIVRIALEDENFDSASKLDI